MAFDGKKSLCLSFYQNCFVNFLVFQRMKTLFLFFTHSQYFFFYFHSHSHTSTSTLKLLYQCTNKNKITHVDFIENLIVKETHRWTKRQRENWWDCERKRCTPDWTILWRGRHHIFVSTLQCLSKSLI